MKQQLQEPASLLLEEVSSVRGELAKAEESLRAAQERFLRLKAAYEVLRDPAARREYDAGRSADAA